MEYKKLTEICNPKQWKTIPKGKLLTIGYPVYGANGIIGYYNEFNHEKETILITCRGASCGSINLSSPKSYITGNAMCLDDLSSIVNVEYLYYYLKNYNFNKVISGSAQPQITRENLKKVDVMIYPLKKQKIIVNILKKIENIHQIKIRILNKFDELVKARFVEMFGDPTFNNYGLPFRSLKNLGSWKSGGTPPRSNPAYFEGSIDWYSAGELNSLFLKDSVEKITAEAINKSSAKLFPSGSLLVGMYDTAAFKMGILQKESSCNQACACIIPSNKINVIFLYFELELMKNEFLKQRRGVRQKNLNLGMIKDFEVPYPSLELQNQFADFVKQVDKSKFIFEPTLFINFPML